MSDTTPTTPPPAPDSDGVDYAKRRRINKRIIIGAAIPLAFFVGIGIGGSSSGDTAAPEPEVKTETVTETVTEEVEVTPQACLDALDASEGLIHQAVIPAFTAVEEMLNAAAIFDTAGIESATADLDALIGDVESYVADYNAAAPECRSTS